MLESRERDLPSLWLHFGCIQLAGATSAAAAAMVHLAGAPAHQFPKIFGDVCTPSPLSAPEEGEEGPWGYAGE